MPRPLTPPEITVRDGLRRHVDILAGLIGERHVWKPAALEAAARYIEKCLGGWGYSVSPQAFTVHGRAEVRNLVAEVHGSKKPQQVLILGAHYDSVESPAAEDNASGVAGVLEIARLLAGKRCARTLRFVLFVNEEPPFYKGPQMGSLVYARRCKAHDEKIVGMINLEMIGCYSEQPGTQRYPYPLDRKWFWFLPRRGNFVAFVGNVGSWRLTLRSWRLFKWYARFPALPLVAPQGVEGPDMSDHWSFWQQGYPAVMVTDTAFFRFDHYHMRTDTPDKLAYDPMARVVMGLARVVGRLAGAKT